MTTVTAATVALVAAVSGCTAAATEPEGLATVTATVAPTASPTPSETPVGPRDLSDPDLGVAFTALPDVTGDAAVAVEVYQQFEVEFWRALTTNELSPSLDVLASPAAVDWVRAQVEPNTAHGWIATGTLEVALDTTEVAVDRVQLAVCTDWREVTFVNQDGTVYEGDDMGEDARSGMTIVLLPTDGAAWRVETYELSGTC
jgi:hypothetical protein